MSEPLVALSVQTPTVNGAQSYEQGAGAKSDLNSAQLNQANASIGLMGQMALGAMGGDINGTVDPQKWATAQALAKAHGLDMSGISAGSAPMLARASISTLAQLQQAQNDRQFQQSLNAFTTQLQQIAYEDKIKANQPITLDQNQQAFHNPNADIPIPGAASGGTPPPMGGIPTPSAPAAAPTGPAPTIPMIGAQMPGAAPPPAGGPPAPAMGAPPPSPGGPMNLGAPIASNVTTWRSVTDPAERKALGISDTDKSPYQVNDRTHEVKFAGSPAASINIGGESANSAAVGKWLGEMLPKLVEAGQTSQNNLANLDVLGNTLAKAGPTGWNGQQILDMRKAAKQIGIDVGDTSDAEVASAISNKMALQLRNPTGGAGMPGSLSDADRVFLTSLVPSLANTPNANAKLIQVYKLEEQRSIDTANMATKYAQDHGGILDIGFTKELADWSAAHPLFDGLQAQWAKDDAGAVTGSPAHIQSLLDKYK